MKLVHFLVFIMISFLFMLTLVMVLNNVDESVVLAVQTGGHIIDLQADYDRAAENTDSKSSKHIPLFQIQGFKFYKKFPRDEVKAHDKVLRRASKVWALHGTQNATGTIEISDLQKFNVKPTKRWHAKANRKNVEERPIDETDVVVQIKYYVNSDVSARLSVIGVNTNAGEQTMEMLDSVVDPSMLCTKLVYLGPVDIVIIEGFAKNGGDFVVVDDLKVAVGVDHADVFGEDAEDMICGNS